jgi:hypothetical protein
MPANTQPDTLIRPSEPIKDAAIRNAIDAVYAARNDGGTMHDAGERAALAVVTTEAQRSDPDQLYDLFGEEWEILDTTVAYPQVKAETPGAVEYWTVS